MTAEPSPLERTLERQLRSCLEYEEGALQRSLVTLQAHWLSDEPDLALRAMSDIHEGRARFLLTDRIAQADALLEAAAGESAAGTLERIAAALAVPLLDPDAPAALCSRAVAKPWGRELWYTGIEARAVCGVTAPAAPPSAASGHRTPHPGPGEIPLPWLLAALPSRYGGVHAPVLLKILDPHAEAVRGDLYFELHEHKQEVYVVTGVDPEAWPDGCGAIRMGFDPEQIRMLGDSGLRRAFAAAVAAYRPLRMEIDALLDGERAARGIAAHAVLDPGTARHLEQQLPAARVARERELRGRIEALTALAPLRVGDVVEVHRRVPHALQHGVRVVEFQTPVYERQILWFGQKVLTQDHWDTAQALSGMRLRPPSPRPPALAHDANGARAERIVDFDDFRVLRIRLEPGASCPLPDAGHAVLMGIDGSVQIGSARVAPEQALLIPGTALPQGLRAVNAVNARDERDERDERDARDARDTRDAGATCLVALPIGAGSAEHSA